MAVILVLACAERPPIVPPASAVVEATRDGNYVLRGAGLELVVSPAIGQATRLSADGHTLLVATEQSPRPEPYRGSCS